jgi:GTPase SAR1 family protein
MSGTLKYDCMFKILLLGDSGVGKTTCLNKYIDGALPVENGKPAPTVGCDVVCCFHNYV